MGSDTLKEIKIMRDEQQNYRTETKRRQYIITQFSIILELYTMCEINVYSIVNTLISHKLFHFEYRPHLPVRLYVQGLVKW